VDLEQYIYANPIKQTETLMELGQVQTAGHLRQLWMKSSKSKNSPLVRACTPHQGFNAGAMVSSLQI